MLFNICSEFFVVCKKNFIYTYVGKRAYRIPNFFVFVCDCSVNSQIFGNFGNQNNSIYVKSNVFFFEISQHTTQQVVTTSHNVSIGGTGRGTLFTVYYRC